MIGVPPALRAPIRRAVLGWYRRHCRPFPWRGTNDPYAILVSEIMLQQTQAARVGDFFRRWMRRFPTVRSLAAAGPREAVLAWGGLGYNRRALHLHAAARAIVRRYRGIVPREPAELRTLPGIGAYTAAAVACFAHGMRTAVVDVNVRRVVSRLARRPRHDAPPLGEEDIVRIAASLLPPRAFANWNQAIMDIGATVCTARVPRCGACPLADYCRSRHRVPSAQRSERTAGDVVPRRIHRGKVIAYLRTLRGEYAASARDIGRHLDAAYDTGRTAWLLDILHSLENDGLVTLENIAARPVRRLGGDSVRVTLVR